LIFQVVNYKITHVKFCLSHANNFLYTISAWGKSPYEKRVKSQRCTVFFVDSKNYICFVNKKNVQLNPKKT